MKKSIVFLKEFLKGILKFLTEFAAIIEQNPPLKEIADRLVQLNTDLEENIQIQGTSITEGITKMKNNFKRQLAESLSRVMILLRDDALKTGNMDLAQKLKDPLCRIQAWSSTKMQTNATEVITLCEQKGEGLTAICITQEMVEELKTLLASFTEYLAKPKEIEKRRKVATKNLDEIEMEVNRLIDGRLTKIVKALFERENPAMWKDYQAIHRNRVPFHKVAVIGTILDAATGQPVNNAWIEIPGTDISYRPYSKTGNFRIKDLEPGKYQLKCTHANYQPITLDFTHPWGETTRLTLNLEMTELARVQKEKEEQARK